MKNNNTYILADISNIVNKVYYANNYGDKKCEDNLMKHNLLNYLETLKNRFNIERKNLICCFDAPFKKEKDGNDNRSWRYNYLEEINEPFLYKGTRTRKEEIYKWLKYLDDNIEKTGFIKLKFNNLEADDIIALTLKYKFNKNNKFYIVSNDEDFYQLLNKNVFIYESKTKETIKIDKNLAKLKGFQKVCCGDVSDNIPKITKNIEPNIRYGEKTVMKMLENIIKTTPEIKDPKITKNVRLILFKNKIIKETLKLYEKKINNKEQLNKIEKTLIKNLNINHKIISFEQIPDYLKYNFNNYLKNLKYKKISEKTIANFYKSEKCFKLSKSLLIKNNNEVSR